MRKTSQHQRDIHANSTLFRLRTLLLRQRYSKRLTAPSNDTTASNTRRRTEQRYNTPEPFYGLVIIGRNPRMRVAGILSSSPRVCVFFFCYVILRSQIYVGKKKNIHPPDYAIIFDIPTRPPTPPPIKKETPTICRSLSKSYHSLVITCSS